MKVLVCGSRGWRNYGLIFRRLQRLPKGSVIVHGASPGGGADLMADRAARIIGLEVIPVPISGEDQAKAGRTRRAPILRNLRMLDAHPDAELLLAFRLDHSPGTTQMVEEAYRRGVPVELHEQRSAQAPLFTG